MCLEHGFGGRFVSLSSPFAADDGLTPLLYTHSSEPLSAMNSQHFTEYITSFVHFVFRGVPFACALHSRRFSAALTSPFSWGEGGRGSWVQHVRGRECSLMCSVCVLIPLQNRRIFLQYNTIGENKIQTVEAHMSVQVHKNFPGTRDFLRNYELLDQKELRSKCSSGGINLPLKTTKKVFTGSSWDYSSVTFSIRNLILLNFGDVKDNRPFWGHSRTKLLKNLFSQMHFTRIMSG